MKAKEYTENYLKSEDKEEATKTLAVSFLTEFKELIKARGIKTEPALLKLIRETDAKWREIALAINLKYPISEPIRYDGFLNMISTLHPKVKIWLENHTIS